MKKEDSYNNLYKKMDATSKTRFHASRRLKLHSKLSTYIIVFVSLALILISLMQAYGLGKNIQSDIVALVQVFSSITILVYSLLIDKNDYSSASEKMYSFASKLGELKQKLYPYLDESFDEANYNKHRDRYHEVLKLYEMHSNNDFRADYFRAKLEMPENYKIVGSSWYKAKFYIYFVSLLSFMSYAVVVTSLLVVLYWVSFGIG